VLRTLPLQAAIGVFSCSQKCRPVEAQPGWSQHNPGTLSGEKAIPDYAEFIIGPDPVAGYSAQSEEET